MSVLLTKFATKVAVEVANCPRPIIVEAVLQACIQFCDLSNAWKEWLDPIAVSTTERAIEIEHPDKARVIKVLNARFDDKKIDPILPNDADRLYPGWDIDLSGTVESIFLRTRDEARLCPHPDADGDLVLEATLRPSEDSISVADFIYYDHAQTIAKGAKAYLMAQVGHKWSNPARAQQLQSEFEASASSENVAQTVGHTRARIRSTLENR